MILKPYTSLLFQLAQGNFQTQQGQMIFTLKQDSHGYALFDMKYFAGQCEHFSVFAENGKCLIEQYPFAQIDDMPATLAMQLFGEQLLKAPHTFYLCFSLHQAMGFLQWFEQLQSPQGYVCLIDQTMDVA